MDWRGTYRRKEEGLDTGPEGGVRVPSEVRIVVLSSASAGIGALEVPGARCVRVATAYEAVAEILAAPAAGLVVDLRLLRGRDLRLLEIARQMDVEILAVGAVPGGLTGEDLSGVRLAARADLVDMLVRLVQPPESSELPKTKQTSPGESEMPETTLDPLGSGEPSERSGERGNEPVTEELAFEKLDPAPAERSGNESAEHTAPAPPAKTPDDQSPERPAPPSALLSPEELRALLEDEP